MKGVSVSGVDELDIKTANTLDLRRPYTLVSRDCHSRKVMFIAYLDSKSTKLQRSDMRFWPSGA